MRGNKIFKLLDFFIGVPLIMLLSLWVKRGSGKDLTIPRPRRILVLKLAALGDAVLMVPALRALRKLFPEAEIIMLGTSLTEPFLRQFPEYIDRFVLFNVGDTFRHPRELFRVVRELRICNIEVAIDFEQWTRITPLILGLLHIPARIGFRTTGQYRDFLYTQSVEKKPAHHEVENFLSLVRLLGGRDFTQTLEIKVYQELRSQLADRLKQDGRKQNMPLVVFHPGCGEHGFPREWPPQNYQELAARLSHSLNPFFVISGTDQESRVMNAVTGEFPAHYSRYNISDVNGYAALLSLSSLLVSGNNGAMHLAAALGIPQIALHGPTNSERWGPLNPNAVVIRSTCPGCPCLDLGFEYHRTDGYCMAQISVDEVFGASQQLLMKKSSS